MATGPRPPGPHGSVAEEIAALAEALRSRSRDGSGTERAPGHGGGSVRENDHDHGTGFDTCEICPVCRAIAVLHTVSPAAVTSLADLAHQAEITLRALASDLHTRGEGASAPAREDIPVDDLGESNDDDVGEDVGDE